MTFYDNDYFNVEQIANENLQSANGSRMTDILMARICCHLRSISDNQSYTSTTTSNPDLTSLASSMLTLTTNVLTLARQMEQLQQAVESVTPDEQRLIFTADATVTVPE